MSDAPSSVRGMNDLLPPESAKWQHLEAVCRDTFARFGYGEARPPVVEHTDLFARGVGEATDVVEKEMYTFPDRGGRSLTLRPELTAGCARAYIEHAVSAKEPVTRWWYEGQMFRYERMQVGRYRQFWQIGCEAYGVAEPTIDAEQIAMMVAVFEQLGIAPVEVLVNNVGSGDDRVRYREALVGYFAPHRAALCGDCQRRLDTNPLRILDCKVPADRALAAGAPRVLDHLGEAATTHFAGLRATLDALAVPYRVEPTLVRGLDYYTGTVFEIVTTSDVLGSQSTICGGGRYDGMIASLGGPPTPAFGFAFGVERAIVLMKDPPEAFAPRVGLYIAAIGAEARRRATALAHPLRLAGVVVEVEHRDVGMKAQFRRADKLGARLTLALGDAELASGQGKLKDMAARTETPIALAELSTAVAAALAR